MKNILIFISFIILSNFVCAQQSSEGQNNSMATELSTSEKIAKIQFWHKQIFSLPFEREFITGTIMEEVKLKRLEVAPHFPSRSQTGDDSETVNTAFINWIENYPSEYTNYLEAVSIIYRSYK